MEDDIQNYLPTVMFRGTPCRWTTTILICEISFETKSLLQLCLTTHLIFSWLDLNLDRRLSVLHNSNLSRFILISLTFCQNANSLFFRIFKIHHHKNNIIQLRLTLLSLSLYTRFLIFKRAVFIYGLNFLHIVSKAEMLKFLYTKTTNC